MTGAIVTFLGVISVVSAEAGEERGATPTAPPPLLVVVERSHGAAGNPEAIRRAIGAELGRPVVGPTELGGKDATQMLVVTLAPDTVTMQMRTAGDAAARRRIQPLAEGESSLRVVAWLAGNLARDQVSELMDALPAAAVIRDPPAPAPTRPPPVSAPMPAAVVTYDSEDPDDLSPTEPSSGEAPWRLEASFGRATSPDVYNWKRNWPSISSTQIQVLAPSRPGRWSWAAALDVFAYPDASIPPSSHSYMTSAGFARRFALVPGWLAADAMIGGGLALSRYLAPDQQADGSVTNWRMETQGPFLVGQVAGNLALVRVRFGELVAGIRVVDPFERWQSPLFTFSTGVRIALQ